MEEELDQLIVPLISSMEKSDSSKLKTGSLADGIHDENLSSLGFKLFDLFQGSVMSLFYFILFYLIFFSSLRL